MPFSREADGAALSHSLSFDHRLIDGALADQFTAKVKSVLEGWGEEVM